MEGGGGGEGDGVESLLPLHQRRGWVSLRFRTSGVPSTGAPRKPAATSTQTPLVHTRKTRGKKEKPELTFQLRQTSPPPWATFLWGGGAAARVNWLHRVPPSESVNWRQGSRSGIMFTYSSQELDLIFPFSALSHGCEGACSDSGSHHWLPAETRCCSSQADISMELIHSHIGQPGRAPSPPPPPLLSSSPSTTYLPPHPPFLPPSSLSSSSISADQ